MMESSDKPLTDKTQTLLVVDDDAEIRELMAQILGQYGYAVATAAEGNEMFAILAKQKIDLIVLDVMLPGDDGFELCRKLRATSSIPIIMLTANGEATDRIVGLEVGADDYVPKPPITRELVARIKAVLRRSIDEPVPAQETHQPSGAIDCESVVAFGDWSLDLATRQLLSPQSVEITLSAGEYDLLVAFIERPRRVLSRDQLLEFTRNRSATPYDRSIDIQVSRLRQKIEVDPKNPSLIKTVRGGGYLFTPEVKKMAIDEA